MLRALDSSHRRRHVLPLELLESLVGHPRVFNGARGRIPVELARGTCRVETRREHGHLVISLEPAGATEGVNVVVESETRLSVYRVTPILGKLFGLVPSGVRIPERYEPEAIGVLSRLAEHVEVRSSSLGLGGSLRPIPRRCCGSRRNPARGTSRSACARSGRAGASSLRVSDEWRSPRARETTGWTPSAISSRKGRALTS